MTKIWSQFQVFTPQITHFYAFKFMQSEKWFKTSTCCYMFHIWGQKKKIQLMNAAHISHLLEIKMNFMSSFMWPRDHQGGTFDEFFNIDCVINWMWIFWNETWIILVVLMKLWVFFLTWIELIFIKNVLTSREHLRKIRKLKTKSMHPPFVFYNFSTFW